MHDAATLPRGRRARAERRRAEKAERRRLEAAEAAALAADAAPISATAEAAPAAAIDPAANGPAGAPTAADVSAEAAATDAPEAALDADSTAAVLELDDTAALDPAALPAEPAARTRPGVDGGQPGALDEDRAGLARTGLVAGIQRGGEMTVLVGARPAHARLSRELLQGQVSLAVGDRVQIVRGAGGRDMVLDVEPRRSRLARIREDRTRRSEYGREEAVLAANVDIAVIVAAVAQPAFHPKLVDRFLVVCQYGGIRPVLCLNKCDLVESPPDVTIYEQLGLPIVHASAATGAGLDELRNLLRGTVAVFTGHSGVGKSSLVNALLGDERQIVGAVRGVNGRGRHTTTWSTLLHWDDESYVVDTPGVRSLGIWKIDPATLGWYFPEFDAFSPSCRFSRCSHTHEPDCAVKEAVETGEIPRQRHESYVRMMDG